MSFLWLCVWYSGQNSLHPKFSLSEGRNCSGAGEAFTLLLRIALLPFTIFTSPTLDLGSPLTIIWSANSDSNLLTIVGGGSSTQAILGSNPLPASAP